MGTAASWVITQHRFEHDEGDGSIVRRHTELDRLDGSLSPAEVKRELEVRYARLYQKGWEETTKPHELAVIDGDGNICVGHEPRLCAQRALA